MKKINVLIKKVGKLNIIYTIMGLLSMIVLGLRGNNLVSSTPFFIIIIVYLFLGIIGMLSKNESSKYFGLFFLLFCILSISFFLPNIIDSYLYLISL